MSSFFPVNFMSLVHKILAPGRAVGTLITHQQPLSVAAALTVVAVMLTGCPQQPQTLAKTPDCQPAAQWCTLGGASSGGLRGRWRIESSALVIEQELQFVVEVNQPVRTISGTVSGVNMAMGTMPLFIDRIAGSRIEGRMLLPACTNDHMRWQAQLTIESINSSTATLVSPVFETTAQP
ncbi:MAG: hypothetical protein II007_04095 [Gammaproteobacteria bacterium]|nr:hypothetical protein [Gammaproteobacteria bacterium]